MNSQQGADRLALNLAQSDLRWGARGARLSSFAILEGEGCELFVRMAQRAGSLFDNAEAESIKSKVVQELTSSEHRRDPSTKPTIVTNDNPLAIWINFLLYHLSLTNPGRERARKIEPDPFALSLLAIERLLTERAIGKVDRSTRTLSDINFRVAMSFPGEHRSYVAAVVGELRNYLASDAIFYDHDYQVQLARPNMDVVLQDIYRNRSALVVVFLCEKYGEKEWCGLEVIVAPHHGADNASSTCFIDAVNPSFVVFPAGHAFQHPRKDAAQRYLDHGVPESNMFRTDRGDDEGAEEWDFGRISGCQDKKGDDDVEIVITDDGSVVVDYRQPQVGC